MLTHINENGRARMVQVGEKEETHRTAVARGRVSMKPETLVCIRDGAVKKGDVLAVAQVAGIMAAKKTADIVPMCHPLYLTGVDMNFVLNEADSTVEIEAEAQTTGRTGVEMEALHAVSAAALTIYDMCKAVDKEMTIDAVRLVYKAGGKTGEYIRGEE